MGKKVLQNRWVTREERKHISPAQTLVGFSGKLLSKKLKPLRRSRSDKIREKALEQDYLDKCSSLACRLREHGDLLELMLELACCNGKELCNSSLCQELKERHANSIALIKFLLEQVGTTLDVLPKQTQVSLHEVLSIDEKLRAKLEKVFQLNFGKEGKFKSCKASQLVQSAATQREDTNASSV
ncbi:uncharacterized protein LOC144637182 [Oculina patagonica]